MPPVDAAALALRFQEALARMQRVVAAVESRVAVQAPVAALEADAAAVLRGDGAWRGLLSPTLASRKLVTLFCTQSWMKPSTGLLAPWARPAT